VLGATVTLLCLWQLVITFLTVSASAPIAELAIKFCSAEYQPKTFGKPNSPPKTVIRKYAEKIRFNVLKVAIRKSSVLLL